MGYNPYVIARLHGFPVEKISIEDLNQDNKKQLTDALSKHELVFYFEMAIDLLEKDSIQLLREIRSNLDKKYDITI
jgi:hypothetical protein